MGIVGVMFYLSVSVFLFFLQGKLNEGVCMHCNDFHSLVERSLKERKSRGSTAKVRKTDKSPLKSRHCFLGSKANTENLFPPTSPLGR